MSSTTIVPDTCQNNDTIKVMGKSCWTRDQDQCSDFYFKTKSEIDRAFGYGHETTMNPGQSQAIHFRNKTVWCLSHHSKSRHEKLYGQIILVEEQETPDSKTYVSLFISNSSIGTNIKHILSDSVISRLFLTKAGNVDLTPHAEMVRKFLGPRGIVLDGI